MMFLRLFRESILFAFNAIVVNKLRTLLSLLGITIGIFAIISVFTVVDAMESKIKNSIESLGNNVLFVGKWPWEFGSNFAWWKYMNRPVPSLDDLREIEKRSTGTEAATFFASVNKTVEYRNNSVKNAAIVGASDKYDKVSNLELSEGRFISEIEYAGGKMVCVLGTTVSQGLFGNEPAIGKRIKALGRKITVIGVLKKEGEDSFGSSSDEQIIIPINLLRSLIDIRDDRSNPMIMVKAKPNVSNLQLRDELTGIMRSVRKLKPAAEDNFAINETSLITSSLEGLFNIITLAGWFIGGFSILVGGFGIANIMFVSVRERTSIIGIQKSLGAKNYFILFQFLFEAIILSVIGGMVGLLLIFIGTQIVSYLAGMSLALTTANISLGIFVSAIIGLVSGFIPAFIASRMDPVEAIRANG
ncbi:MAG: ABC transporter permease [Bacteroidota bacterium]